MPQINDLLKKDTLLDYHQFGTFTTQDFVRLQKSNPETLKVIPLYSKEELNVLEAKAKVTIDEVETQSLCYVKQWLNSTTKVKMVELVAEYCLSMMLKDKAG